MIRRALFIIILIFCFTGFIFAYQSATLQKSPSAEEAVQPPVITFENTEHDFGDVDTDASVECIFKFKNTGGSLLKIESIQVSCGCIVTELEKKEYQPGESGQFSITFSTNSTVGPVSKYAYVLSNDKKDPRLTVTIKANVVRRVQITPDPIVLSLRKPNAGCPDINVFSIDGKEFAITGFRTVPDCDCIHVVFDPCSKAARFTLKPTVDIKSLNKKLNGSIVINTTHPKGSSISAIFEAPALYKTEPTTILMFNAEPGKPLKRDKVWLTSNYNEDFEIESTSSENGFVKAVNIEKVSSGRYSMNLELTPPKQLKSTGSSTPTNFFTDTFIIKLKNGDRIDISCRVFYANQKAAAAGK